MELEIMEIDETLQFFIYMRKFIRRTANCMAKIWEETINNQKGVEWIVGFPEELILEIKKTMSLFGIKDKIVDKIFQKHFREFFDFQEEFYPIIEAYAAIVQMQSQLENDRKRQRTGRGHWEGGGFGISGAIKGALTAEAMNIGMGLLRGISDSIVSARDNAKIRQLELALGNEIKERKTIPEIVFRRIDNISIVLQLEYFQQLQASTDTIPETLPFVGDKKQAEALFKANRSFFTGERITVEALNCLGHLCFLYPYSRKYYEILGTYTTSTEYQKTSEYMCMPPEEWKNIKDIEKYQERIEKERKEYQEMQESKKKLYLSEGLLFDSMEEAEEFYKEKEIFYEIVCWYQKEWLYLPKRKDGNIEPVGVYSLRKEYENKLKAASFQSLRIKKVYWESGKYEKKVIERYTFSFTNSLFQGLEKERLGANYFVACQKDQLFWEAKREKFQEIFGKDRGTPILLYLPDPKSKDGFGVYITEFYVCISTKDIKAQLFQHDVFGFSICKGESVQEMSLKFYDQKEEENTAIYFPALLGNKHFLVQKQVLEAISVASDSIKGTV